MLNYQSEFWTIGKGILPLSIKIINLYKQKSVREITERDLDKP